LISFWLEKKSMSLPNLPGIELNSQRVYGEISSEHIHLDGTHFNYRQRCGKLVIFHPCRCHIYLETVRKYDDGGSEFLVGMYSCPEFTGKRLGESDPVSFDDDIDIFIGSIQEKVPDKSTHHIGIEVKTAGGFP
jgi:hypothetical protein